MVWRDVRPTGHGPLLLRPPSRSEHGVGDLSPESACAGVIVLKADRPRTPVPGEHLDSQPAPDPLTTHSRGNPESRYRPPVTGEPFDQREPHWRFLAGIEMSPPGQVPRAVRRGKSLQLSCLVPAVGVREPVDNGGQVMPEHLPQPGHDHPLIIRHRSDAEQTTRVGLARTVRTSASHPAEPTASSNAPPGSRRSHPA
jgi:hypothetical protein